METFIVALLTFCIGVIIGSIVENKHNKKLAMEAWRNERKRFNESN
jgi:MFS-type transporter involved in bile tolerance (Atg22 family)